MQLTPKIKGQIEKVVWDYNVDEKTLEDIFEGRKEIFSLNKFKLYARLLMSVYWYKLLDCLGVMVLRRYYLMK